MGKHIPLSAAESLERLKAGNARFVDGGSELFIHPSAVQRSVMMEGQHPFAAVIGCSDSRVPVEIVFDHGLGDLFVIRVAGNVVSSSVVGSIEYAITKLQTRLVVVLGHSHCGAVGAILDGLGTSAHLTPSLQSIFDRIQPTISAIPDATSEEELAQLAIRDNVRASVNHLKHDSPILRRLIDEEGVRVVGADYSLLTGEVEFFEGVPLDPHGREPS